MYTEKTFEEYIDEVHAAALAIDVALDGVEPPIQMAALVKVTGSLIFMAVKAGVFSSLPSALEHYNSGIKAMNEDLTKHMNKVKQ